MAIRGRDNVIELLRMQKTPYWKLAQTAQARSAGNYVATADFTNPDLGIEASLDALRTTLDRLTSGRYVLVAFQSAENTKRGGVDTDIEIESGGIAAISGIAAQPKLILDGIGEVTPENFNNVIEQKFKAMRAQEKEEQRIKDLEAENKRLKAEASEYSSGVNKGLYSIGALIWEQVRQTKGGRELAGMIGQAMGAAARSEKPQNDRPAAAMTEASTQPGAEDATGESRCVRALSSMLDGKEEDPAAQNELADQLELLAQVKKNNPALLEQGLNFIKNMG